MVSLKTHYVRVGSGPIGGENFTRVGPLVNRIINEELSRVGEEGLGEAQGFVDIAGTNDEWSGWFKDLHQGGGARDRSGRGRINTGAMRKALDFRVYRGQEIGLDIGWIHPATYEDYMGEQEHGFTHPGYRNAAQRVEGMGMFQHLRVYLRGKVSDAADRVMERIEDGL